MKAFTTILILGLLALAACAPAPTDEGKQMPQGAVRCEGERPEICTMDYNPVCGNDDTTYGNACGACSNPDVQYYIPGECDGKMYVSQDPAECSLIRYMCVEGKVPFSDETGCGCEPGEFVDEQSFTACEDPRPEACTKEYLPVCASRDNGIRCITEPCPSEDLKTYGNKCEACADALVYGYTQGACAEEVDNNPSDDDASCAAVLCEVGSTCVKGECIPQDEQVPPCAATLCMVGSICVEGKGCVEQQLMVCANEERKQMAEQFGFTCVDACPSGMDEYASQLGPRCIVHYGEEQVSAWETCEDATSCSEDMRCALATHTTDGQEFFTAIFRCVPDDYANLLIHTVGLTTRDESGEQSTVIA